MRTFGWDVVASGPDDSSSDEQQEVTLGANTIGGKFALNFGPSFARVTTGAVATGNVTAGSTSITNLSIAETSFSRGPNGSFEIGEVITGTGIPAETTITEVTPIGLTMSQPATSSGSNRTVTGFDIPYNATPAQVADSLEALPTVQEAGG